MEGCEFCLAATSLSIESTVIHLVVNLSSLLVNRTVVEKRWTPRREKKR